MILKEFKPSTPSQRSLTRLDNSDLIKKPLLKIQNFGCKNKAGRNNSGKITVRHRGSGHKKKYRKINFLRNTNDLGIVTSIEYDPYRTANIASIFNFVTKEYYYMLHVKNLKIGDIIKSGSNAEIKNGHSLEISKIPVGSLIHNISPKVKSKAQISRSAGAFSRLVGKTTHSGRIKLSSGEQRSLSNNCFATIGVVSNALLSLTTIGKAGRSRWLNRRPKVRGVAMNPVDHPHGGGEGKTSGGRTSVTPWGKPTKGGNTSRSTNSFIIVKRKK
tara:strand:+ start:14121 stop:14939 length:819 start_codon:yes stop_codon:yes gene_type:complete